MTDNPVDRVRGYLHTAAPDLDVVEYDVSTATAPLAAAAVGCEVGAIVKSLCFVVDGQPVVALVAGDMKADDRKLGTLFGVAKSRVKIADPETVTRVTGYSVGGVPPVAHATPVPVVIDASLQRYVTVYAAAGASNAIFAIPLSRLIELTNGQVADIVKA
ncbi:MAG: YbaK/EbsC family protein [Anaerolineae bacterium]